MSSIQQISIDNEVFFKIENSNHLRPFFMSIVSDSNHWMFISSNGGLSAGRKNSEFALFPYYTDDKITESRDVTGSKTIIRIDLEGKPMIWEPFSDRYQGVFKIRRNLYKNKLGNKILFEEINEDLALSFSYQWSTSNVYGFVRKAQIKNLNDRTANFEILDGIQNIMPHGVNSFTQNNTSNLVDAYKRSELHEESGLGIFALSAIIVDKAEPSEALKANTVWSYGLSPDHRLLSSLQLNQFRTHKSISTETDVKGERGAYFQVQSIRLGVEETKEWFVVANVNQDHADVTALIKDLSNPENIIEHVNKDITLGSQRLVALNASADGLQSTADPLRDARHFSNTLFNIMRGGVFDFNYTIEKNDFSNYLKKANINLFNVLKSSVQGLPEIFDVFELKKLSSKIDNPDFTRLAVEYLPLKFSRRHGDPSRPWNKFSINTRSEIDGSKILDYEGNWRDIFQNWEALALSFPEFIEGMIFKFLNASTFDGYNPYRVTKDGFDWETIEPDDPWSYIGYWGDHQIIYLQKFLEIIHNYHPGQLQSYYDKDIFVYAHVPYIIKSYEDILKNPKDTIEFDEKEDSKIRKDRDHIGADGALHKDENGSIYRVNLIEKLLATILAKMSNFIPEGGIWMNTQRPEWNDANNALVGNGVSMVTLYYLYRFMKFFREALDKTSLENVKVSGELVDCYKQIRTTLIENEELLNSSIKDSDKKKILDALGRSASDYRQHIYQTGFWGKKRSISIDGLKRFADISLKFMNHAIQANKRHDDLYHAYNIVTIQEEELQISYLSEMLEGQVAVLSSGMLSPKEALSVLDALKNSALFRPDQYSYILYPNNELKGFLDKNTIPKNKVESSELLKVLVKDGNEKIITKDVNGAYHFNGNFKNANDLDEAMLQMNDSSYGPMVKKERSKILQIFESVFNHKAFTGRSGTFFGYEGLGSIYWHMVSKLLLATQECCLQAIESNADDVTIGKLLEHFYEINEGIGVHKSPELYGAFPTDPYSHTPSGKGAQQPGMTGQVKEDILSRFGELGIFVKDSKMMFYPCLLRANEEFHKEEAEYKFVDIHKNEKTFIIPPHSMAFSIAQVPVFYHQSKEANITITFRDGTSYKIKGNQLPENYSNQIFKRTGEVVKLDVEIPKHILK